MSENFEAMPPELQALHAALRTLLSQDRSPQDLRRVLAGAIAVAAEQGLAAATNELEHEVEAYRPYKF